ncbi:hypothetical protein [uncultured Methanolobus sp.]|uniref:hypothetical protein n=1 Tax=uncultured Methanolobus sp. TaxID=218300 RepID=UPI002AABB064|nr:hypothetical protein [uncultured Methanolobus sp.]
MKFPTGSKVTHKHYGTGTVQGYFSDKQTYLIDFGFNKPRYCYQCDLGSHVVVETNPQNTLDMFA